MGYWIYYVRSINEFFGRICMDCFYGKKSSEYAKKTYLSEDIGGEVEKYNERYILGEYNTYHLLSDPKRVGFLFARYKFISKMLEGKGKVLEIGCQEGLGTLVVSKTVEEIVATDFFKPHIEICKKTIGNSANNIIFRGHDIIDSPVDGDFDAAYSLDVFEHIDPAQEHLYMQNIISSINDNGVLIIGTPSKESQIYASVSSKAGHINCKSGYELKKTCEKYFNNVFMFGMNDEVVHTGFLPMAHYLFALCVGKRKV
jgi:2-polyprenyl-3-methyl-5-hydroxy-6-metoxy-1,4-benzoquinol methylase